VNKMVCEDCLTIFYSAAARTLVERRQPCPNCGGRLILDEEDPVGDDPGLSLVAGEGGGPPSGVDRRVGERRRGERRVGPDRRRTPSRFPRA
jgi:DNA-directed RNA polymerase subunit RPC12/RpoP